MVWSEYSVAPGALLFVSWASAANARIEAAEALVIIRIFRFIFSLSLFYFVLFNFVLRPDCALHSNFSPLHNSLVLTFVDGNEVSSMRSPIMVVPLHLAYVVPRPRLA